MFLNHQRHKMLAFLFKFIVFQKCLSLNYRFKTFWIQFSFLYYTTKIVLFDAVQPGGFKRTINPFIYNVEKRPNIS